MESKFFLVMHVTTRQVSLKNSRSSLKLKKYRMLTIDILRGQNKMTKFGIIFWTGQG